MRSIGFGLAAALAAAGAGAAHAADGGFYMGAEAGLSLARTLEATRTNVGVQTNCDGWLAPYTFADGSAAPRPAGDCAPRALPARANAFALSAGPLAGLAVGYAWPGPLRVEAEYLHRRQGGEKRSLTVPGDPKQREFVERSEEISELRADSLFVNVYYDFAPLAETGLAPWIGAGAGLSRVALDYRGTSIRGSAETLLGLDPPRNPDAAGRVSYADETFSDRLWSWQVMAGADYALGAGRALTAKFRYGAAFEDFQGGLAAWRSLRGHASTAGPGGAPVRYGISAEAPAFWGLSLGLKFFF